MGNGWGVFFFPNQNAYFFPSKSLQPNTSLVLRGRKQKTDGEKKQFFHSLTVYPKMYRFLNFPEKKIRYLWLNMVFM